MLGNIEKVSSILIDFDGTLCTDRFWSSAEPRVQHFAAQHLFGQDSSRVSRWMKGLLTSEEINEWLAAQLDLPFQSLWSDFQRDCEQFRVDEKTLRIVNSLREGRIEVLLVTDNMDCFSRFTAPSLHLYDYFTGVVNSADIGRLKREGEDCLLATALMSIGGVPERSMLIDDSAANTMHFQQLGGIALQVNHPQETLSILDSLQSVLL